MLHEGLQLLDTKTCIGEYGLSLLLPQQLYEDAVEMQLLFIKIRDELCKNGELLLTPALSYTERHLQNALETEKREKLAIEQKEDEEKKKGGESEEKLEEVKLVSDAHAHDCQIEKINTYRKQCTRWKMNLKSSTHFDSISIFCIKT